MRPPRLLRLAIATLGLCLALPATVGAAAWTVAEGSAIRFEAYQQGAPVQGAFPRFTADILFDPDDLAGSRIAVEIDTTSVTTGHKDRDAVVRSPNLLDVERWPSARFASARIEKVGDDAYEAHGELTLRAVAKEVVLPFTLHMADDPRDLSLRRAEARGELTISRLDFGVGQGEWASTATVGDKVVIAIEITATARR
ncbi:MAG TPA: YceI family protein [Geminicoccaceae bacterium]|nr:YceI family protein [Geminicoccaceae bacterium]